MPKNLSYPRARSSGTLGQGSEATMTQDGLEHRENMKFTHVWFVLQAAH